MIIDPSSPINAKTLLSKLTLPIAPASGHVIISFFKINTTKIPTNLSNSILDVVQSIPQPVSYNANLIIPLPAENPSLALKYFI